MKPFDLVMLNMSTFPQWDVGKRNRNYYIAKFFEHELSVRRIVHVDFFPVSLRHVVRDVLQTRIQSCPGKVIHKSFTTVVRKRSEKIFHVSSVASILRPSQLVNEIQAALTAIGVHDHVLWSYNPLHPEVFGNLAEKLSVFDTVDNWAYHQNYKARQNQLKENYKDISKKANIIFTVSEDLLQIFPDHDNTHWMPNGVDSKEFSPDVPKNTELMKLAEPRVGYAGVIEDRFDTELVEYLASRNPKFSFIIGGMMWDKTLAPRLRRFDNISVFDHYIPGDEFPSFMNAFDALIIPHKITEFTKSMQPMKVYEGLALGKPIVSTNVSGLGMFDDVILVAKSKEEFHTMLNNVLNADSPDKQRERRERVKSHSWDARGKAIIDILSKHLP